MSNDVQSHEEVAERVAGEERRASARHTALSLGSVTARIIGGSQVDLVNFSTRGVLFECDSRLLIGARASVRITTPDTNLIVTGRVVRSRVKGLVNGALRYDAALVLDAELGLMPKFVVDASAAGDDSSEFESEIDAAFDPSPVEAYLAESEASLLEVAQEADLVLHNSDYAAPAAADLDVAPEPPPIPDLASPPIEAASLDVSAEAEAEPEPIAFEADAEIAFEPAVEFAFDEAGEPSFDDPVVIEAVEPAAAEPGGTSMFDATYMPPAADDTVVAASQFDVTPPTAVLDAAPASFFDASQSESYGEPSAETAVAFEAEDGVMFEAAVEGASAIDEPAPVDVVVTDSLDALVPPPLPVAAPDDIDSRAAVSDTEDRVLLQFAATVPHDLAELRRIAADNQW